MCEPKHTVIFRALEKIQPTKMRNLQFVILVTLLVVLVNIRVSHWYIYNKSVDKSIQIANLRWYYNEVSLFKWEMINQFVERDALMNVFQPGLLMAKYVLLVELYLNPLRRDEVLIALQINLLNPFIDRIIVFQTERYDFSRMYMYEKIVSIKSEKRASIGTMIQMSERMFPSFVLILANSDIHFDNTLIHAQTIPPRHLMTISRQGTVFGSRKNLTLEILDTNFFNNFCTFYHASHDAFIMRSPIDADIIDELKKIYLGEWGGDNYINQIFRELGWQLSNPCYSILAKHLHSFRSPERDQSKRQLGDLYGKFGIQHPPVSKYDPEVPFEVPRHYWEVYFANSGRNNKV